MTSRNGMVTLLGLAGIAVGGFYLYDRGRMEGERLAEDKYGVAGHAGSRLDRKAAQWDQALRNKTNTLRKYTQEELDEINARKEEAARSINERIEGVDRKFEKKATDAKHGMLSWFGWGGSGSGPSPPSTAGGSGIGSGSGRVRGSSSTGFETGSGSREGGVISEMTKDVKREADRIRRRE
ncbi:hypothetical protein KEM52_000369 [Ascosphaera acerosa]|nr:hypothetical protein KEM52_000369 [Ascosphaera acerosa]